ncbi:uncharacterized protein LOC128211610 [Mya arenaria]|uniref:uncharacterized protein LOC128211610 n=1 Tax=Mya arenaria TaxID=6604 RepID=UPI0022E50A79|nr:uncharacterized protein LOC128211610 [Mya arenaria]
MKMLKSVQKIRNSVWVDCRDKLDGFVSVLGRLSKNLGNKNTPDSKEWTSGKSDDLPVFIIGASSNHFQEMIKMLHNFNNLRNDLNELEPEAQKHLLTTHPSKLMWGYCLGKFGCMVPDLNPEKYLACNKYGNVFGECHRFDQSVLSILLYTVYGKHISEHTMHYSENMYMSFH